MPLQKQLLDVPLSLGLDQKTDVRGLQSAGAAIMSNCVKLKNGAIRKRFGTSALSRTATNFGTITSALGGGSHKNAQWMTDGANIYAYSDKEGQWQNQDKIPEAIALDRLQVAAFTQQVVDYDMSVANGLLHAVFLAPSPMSATLILWDTILDVSSFGSATGIGGVQQGVTATVVEPLNLVDPAAPATLAPKIFACGTNSILTYVRGATLFGRKLDLTNPGAGWSGEFTIVATISAFAQTGIYDSCPVNGDTTRFAVSCAVGTTTNLYIVTVSSMAVTTGPKALKAIDSASSALVAYNQSYYMAVVCNSGTRQYFTPGYDEGTNTLIAGTVAVDTAPVGGIGKCAIEKSGATQFTAVVSSGFAAGVAAMQNSFVSYAPVTLTGDTPGYPLAPKRQTGVQLASRPVYNAANGLAYFAVYTPSLLQGTTYVACAILWSDIVTGSQPLESNVLAMRPVVTLEPRLQKGSFAVGFTSGVGSFVLPHFPALSTVPNSGGLGVYLLPTVFSTETFHTAGIAQPVDFSPAIAYRSAELGDSTLVTCGLPTLYDGQLSCEAGYCAYPEVSVAMSGPGTGGLSAGSYQYSVTFEWYDTRGQIHRSAPSAIVTATAAASDQAQVTISSPALTMRVRLSPASALNVLPLSTHIYAVIYRTTVGGTLFYRVTADPPPATMAYPNGTQTLVILDAATDASITAAATAQLLYTTGGFLPNVNPPSARCIVQHTQRWVLAGCDNPRQVWASKTLTDGEAPGFHETLAFDATGSVRALASLDGNLIIFVQRGPMYGIEYVPGQGPTDAGTQSDWTPPVPIPSAVGAVDQRGTCVGPFGVLFRSPVGGPNGTGGLFVLSRDLQVTYVSGPVEDSLAACPIVTSMVVHPNAGRVYITTVQSDTSPVTTGGATRLVWDYLESCWSTDTLWDMDASATGLPVRAAWIAQAGGIAGAPQGPTYHCASSSGRVYRESFGMGAGAYLDAGGQWVTMRYRGSLWKPSLGGFARMWRLQMQADSLESHDYTVTLTFDGAPAPYYNESVTWTAVQAAQFDRFPQLDTEMLIDNQKARSVQVEIFDATPTGGGATTGQGASWAGFSLELGVKEGLYKNIPAGQRA